LFDAALHSREPEAFKTAALTFRVFPRVFDSHVVSLKKTVEFHRWS
jgi:hypothetical protein